MDIDQHYSSYMDETRLLTQLRQKYPEGPTIYQLAPIDQLHIGGIKASEKLLQQLQEIQPRRILEIGSGAGGLMRMISSRHSAEIIGIDITHRFNSLNKAISALTNLSDCQVITCDAQQLPFADSYFDCIIFQHSLLNIPDSKRCLQECSRVMTPDGRLLLHEVLQGPHPDKIRYPVPWARAAEQSHLITIEGLTAILADSGFALNNADNWSQEALEWRQRQASKEQNQSRISTLSPAQILGDSFSRMAPNVMSGLREGAVEVWQLTCRGQKAE